MDKAPIHQLAEYLNSVKPLSSEAMKQIVSLFSHRRYRKHEIFLNIDDMLEYVGFNLNGIFRYYYIDIEGKDRTKYFVSHHDFIVSLTALIRQSPSLFAIEALVDSDVLLAPADRVRALIATDPYWQAVYRHVLETTYVIKEYREAEFLLCDAKTRYLHFLRDFPEIDDRVRQHYIASYLGMTPESLSRIRTEVVNS